MRYDFCTTIRDKRLNVPIIKDLKCEVDVETSASGDDFDVGAVYLDGTSLESGGPISKYIARRVREAAKQEISEGGRLFQEIMR